MANFLTKFLNGIKVLGLSFKLFFKHPKYFLFPLLNIFLITAFFSLIYLTINFTIGWQAFFDFMSKFSKEAKQIRTTQDYVIFTSFFVSIILVCTYIFSLISVAVSFFSMKALEREPVTVSQALMLSIKKSWKLIKWALVATIVGIIIRAARDNKSFGAKILALIGGVIWSIATFFIFPVIAFENLSVFASIKYSANVFKKTFGETSVAAFGFGLIEFLIFVFFPLGFLWLTVMVLAGFHDILTPLVSESNLIQAILFISPTMFLTIFAMAILSTVKTIFKTAIYAYCTNRPTGIFPAELIKASFVQK
jgi:hypothetical protein